MHGTLPRRAPFTTLLIKAGVGKPLQGQRTGLQYETILTQAITLAVSPLIIMDL